MSRSNTDTKYGRAVSQDQVDLYSEIQGVRNLET